MKEFAIEDIPAESVLAADLTTDAGIMVLHKGTSLTSPILARLQRMGIEKLTIVAELNPEEQAEKAELLEEKFRGYDDNELMMEIKRIATEHISQL